MFGRLSGPLAVSAGVGAVAWGQYGPSAGLGVVAAASAGLVAVESLSRPTTAAGGPRWELFATANVGAVCTLVAAALHVMEELGGLQGAVRSLLVPGIALKSPSLALSLLLVVASVTYLTGYATVGAVGWLLEQEKAEHVPQGTRKGAASAKSGPGGVVPTSGTSTASPAASTSIGTTDKGSAVAPSAVAAARAAVWAGLPEGRDADVIVAGAGTAGAALATVLARRGLRVLLFDPMLDIPARIVGELMQPGGVRCLERLGLEEAAKGKATNGIRVDGYACVPAGATDASNDVVLTYPDEDPASGSACFGFVPEPATPKISGRSDTPTAAVSDPVGVDPSPRGRSFHNHHFVQALRRMASQEPNVRFVHGRVTSTEERDGRVVGVQWAAAASTPPADAWPILSAQLPTDKATPTHLDTTALAPITILCDGSASGLRRGRTQEKPKAVSYFAGLLLRHDAHKPPLPYPNRGHVIMAAPSPVLLYQISPGETRLLVDIPLALGREAEPAALKSYVRSWILPQMPAAVRPTILAALDEQELDVCSNRVLPAAPAPKPGAVLLGDAWNMRHPLTGGGMTVALTDVEHLANALTALAADRAASLPPGTPMGNALEGPAIDPLVPRFQQARRKTSAVINILANALYRVFSVPDQAPTMVPASSAGKTVTWEGDWRDDAWTARRSLRDACVEYLQLGGAPTRGPVGLLAGITPSPMVLTIHYILVALYASRKGVFPIPTPHRLLRVYQTLLAACQIIMPLLHAEQATFLSHPVIQFVVNLIFPWKHVSVDAPALG